MEQAGLDTVEMDKEFENIDSEGRWQKLYSVSLLAVSSQLAGFAVRARTLLNKSVVQHISCKEFCLFSPVLFCLIPVLVLSRFCLSENTV